jgi:hypothetical protein
MVRSGGGLNEYQQAAADCSDAVEFSSVFEVCAGRQSSR